MATADTVCKAKISSCSLYRGFRVTILRPAFANAYSVRIHSGWFGPQTPIVSPGLNPTSTKAFAKFVDISSRTL